MRVSPLGILRLLLFAFIACSWPIHAFQDRSLTLTKTSSKPIKSRVPLGISESLWQERIPKDNPMSREKVALGRALFFEKRLSRDGTVSCAVCHDPARAFTDANNVAIGTHGNKGTRNSPTLLNTMFSDSLFWDGRADSLENQVKHPLQSPFEMGLDSEPELVARITIQPYKQQFQRVFKEGINLNTIAKAIAAYERTLLSGNSPFDRFIAGNKSAISEAQRRGWELFKGKAKCIECHTFAVNAPFFTDFKFHNTGVAASDSLFSSLIKRFTGPSRHSTSTALAHTEGVAELGRYAITLERVDVGAFKTPTLRDVELTWPYMHNGSLSTLIDVVRFYNNGGRANSHLDVRMRALQLSEAEVTDLTEFLRSLTSDDVLKECQTSNPQKRTPVSLPQRTKKKHIRHKQ